MKRLLAIMAVLICVNSAFADVKKAVIKPFNDSYSFTIKANRNTAKAALSDYYLWFNDVDYTDPVGIYDDLWYEVDRLHDVFPGEQFTPFPYPGCDNGWEYGYDPYYTSRTCVIYSNMHR